MRTQVLSGVRLAIRAEAEEDGMHRVLGLAALCGKTSAPHLSFAMQSSRRSAPQYQLHLGIQYELYCRIIATLCKMFWVIAFGSKLSNSVQKLLTGLLQHDLEAAALTNAIMTSYSIHWKLQSYHMMLVHCFMQVTIAAVHNQMTYHFVQVDARVLHILNKVSGSHHVKTRQVYTC